VSRLALALALIGVASCAPASDLDRPAYHAEDISPENDTVDPASLVDDETFTEMQLTAADIQRYLERTHYGTRSFLADYRGGDCGDKTWCTAAESVAAAAKTHRINPVVLLAMGEVVGQLLSATEYPALSARVEYAFGCGCTPSGCDPVAGSWAKQIDCIARQMRERADSASLTPLVTKDGVAVGNPNRASVAIYGVLGGLARGGGGAWTLARIVTKIRTVVGSS
jgi:hypothetical protein